MQSGASLSLTTPHPHALYCPRGGPQGLLLRGGELIRNTLGVAAISLVGLAAFKIQVCKLTAIINVWKMQTFFEHSDESVLGLGF